ncbi:MAG: hypothetical protein ACP5HK_04875 [Acidilobus sp.]
MSTTPLDQDKGDLGQDRLNSSVGPHGNGDSNVKFVLFKVLSALKHFYSFKELEERLGVSAQILWRYVSLRSVPERLTAEKLLQKIDDEGLVDEALRKALGEGEELWQILSSPGVMALAELKVLNSLKGDKVNAVITGPDGYSTAFGAVIADALHARLCVASRSPYSRHIITKHYKVSQDYYDTLMFPRECIPRRGRALLVLVDGNKAPQLSAILDIVRARQASVAGVLVVVGSDPKVQELVKAKIGSETKVLTLTKPCEAQDPQCGEEKEPTPVRGNG